METKLSTTTRTVFRFRGNEFRSALASDVSIQSTQLPERIDRDLLLFWIGQFVAPPYTYGQHPLARTTGRAPCPDVVTTRLRLKFPFRITQACRAG